MPLEPIINTKFKPDKSGRAAYPTFNGGLNSFFRDTEIQPNELSRADNLILVGSGVPTKRYGSANYNLAGESGYVRGIGGYYDSTSSTNELLVLTDWGFLTKKSGASYTMITGASFSSGYAADMEQLNKNMYIMNGQQALTKYDGTNLVEFTALSVPDGLTATNLSGVSGTYTYSWRVSAFSETGETLASSRVILGNLPQNLADTLVNISWSAVSPASSVQGYGIYGRDEGNETYITTVDQSSTTFLDDGDLPAQLLKAPPTGDSTAGPTASYIISHQGRLIVAGFSANPTRVMWSGVDSFSEKFYFGAQGGYLDIDADSGDDITGLGIFEDNIIIFKERSVHVLKIEDKTYTSVTTGRSIKYTEGDSKPLTQSHGCISNKTIAAVENDLFYLSRDGVYVLGYEPNLLNTIRTNEISVKVRDYFAAVTYADLQMAAAEYLDKRYTVSFRAKKQFLSYDRERVAWTGPHETPYGINTWLKYYDSAGSEKWLAGTDDSYVVEFAKTYKSDRGTAFSTLLKTRKEDFGSSFTIKSLLDAILELRSIDGNMTVTVYYEDESGRKSIINTIDAGVTANSSGWGSFQWGDAQWANSPFGATTSTLDDTIKRIIMEKKGRTVQVEISTDGSSDNYELLSISLNAKGRGRGSLPYEYNI